MTKEERKIYDRAYRLANKETLRAYQKGYRDANKEDLKDYYKKYRANNKSIIDNRSKEYTEATNLGYYIIYALPNAYNDERVYCGMTQNSYKRMISHKHSGRNTEGWFVLDVCQTKQEALLIEASYHDKGYAGKKTGRTKLNQI